MTYKEFKNWCSDRTIDGNWNLQIAYICISIVNEFDRIPFWKREKEWHKRYGDCTSIF